MKSPPHGPSEFEILDSDRGQDQGFFPNIKQSYVSLSPRAHFNRRPGLISISHVYGIDKIVILPKNRAPVSKLFEKLRVLSLHMILASRTKASNLTFHRLGITVHVSISH